jgi:hypothetical protein
MGPGEILMFIYFNLMLAAIPLEAFLLTSDQTNIYQIAVVIIFGLIAVGIVIKRNVNKC